MSNRRRACPPVPEHFAALARASECPDCGGKATVRWDRANREFRTSVHHHPECPALRGSTNGKRAAEERAVDRVNEAAGTTVLRYCPPDGKPPPAARPVKDLVQSL